jgi:hypothetical protein
MIAMDNCRDGVWRHVGILLLQTVNQCSIAAHSVAPTISRCSHYVHLPVNLGDADVTTARIPLKGVTPPALVVLVGGRARPL